jgi:NADP-dependent 3-hydroxy acid dehydrogenase YdfG
MDVRDAASIARGIQTVIAQARRIDVPVQSAGDSVGKMDELNGERQEIDKHFREPS